MQKIKPDEQVDLKDNLFFAGTIYESFEALEEVLGKLKLEQPLFLVYLAKKSFAEEVFKAAGETEDATRTVSTPPPSYIEIFNTDFQRLQ